MADGGAPSKLYLWAGRIMTALPIILMTLSGFAKITRQTMVIENMTQKFGYQDSAILPIGIIEVACALLYAIPRTSALGAVLVTAFLGGAVATHVRVDDVFIGAIIV